MEDYDDGFLERTIGNNKAYFCIIALSLFFLFCYVTLI